jgi:hypothetical protein
MVFPGAIGDSAEGQKWRNISAAKTSEVQGIAGRAS